ncbi:autotransporter outer membrane beta-barrel domain-containing protein [Persicitalea jodogahamensis]|nr:autotransporter outer membrane beta-barrel domain-containing protein [Persicitalea jodogahamensis]
MKNYLLAVTLLLPLGVLAQTSIETSNPTQGRIQIGIVESVGYNNKSGGFIRTNPYAQYFIKDNWAIRLEGRHDFYGPVGVDGYLGAGLSTRFNFLQTNRWLLYGQAGYFYGQYRGFDYKKVAIAVGPIIDGLERIPTYSNQGMLSVGVGAQYKIGSRWSINAQVEKNFTKHRSNEFNATLGVGFKIK